VLPARRLADDGIEAWDEVKRRSLEGMVAKRAESPYRGGRTRDWLKVKIRREGRFVVVGLAISDGAPSGLLVAAREGRRLVWCGTAEWGVGRKAVETVLARSTRVIWLQPRVVVEVSYSEMLQGRLRDPVLRRTLP
jgi:bifunctional non-homologous end joining protein LigD